MNLKTSFITKTKEQRLYQMEKPVIGLTGGIASGKSTVSKMLISKGLKVIDADQLVKSIYQSKEAKDYIKNHYPKAWINEAIDFKELRKLFFQDQNIKSDIERFIYQRLPQAFLTACQESRDQDFIIYDVPLLFEKGLDKLVDASVLVYSPKEIQRQRLMDRDGHLEEMADQILAHQMPIDEKKQKADLIIDNSGSLEELAAEVEHFLQQVFE